MAMRGRGGHREWNPTLFVFAMVGVGVLLLIVVPRTQREEAATPGAHESVPVDESSPEVESPTPRSAQAQRWEELKRSIDQKKEPGRPISAVYSLQSEARSSTRDSTRSEFQSSVYSQGATWVHF